MVTLAHSFDGVPGLFALGMSWRHENGKPGRSRLKALSEMDGRWGLVRKSADGQFQAGFCDPVEGVEKGSVAITVN
ncbi:hypothetical protein AT984_04365 [Paucibacter sp. KCTC 42545]|nr:hypothetical protein AT984_04365 [Paucibacter sp. KCTC 42545]